ncbi:MAG TPA: hypothetical protein VGB87_22530, partial [Vicinamibacteria bacterium]
PYEVPPVFADGRVLLFARLEKPAPATVALTATGPDGPVRLALPLDPAAADQGTLVATLWARRMIRDLEEGRSPIHPRRGSQQARALGLKDEAVKAEIVRLGTTFGLASRHTSYVAVEERETPTEGEAQLRKVPVMITRGWHGLGLVAGLPAVAAQMVTRASSALGAAPRAYDDFDLQEAGGACFERADMGAPRPKASRASRFFDRARDLVRSSAPPPATPAMPRVPSTRAIDRLVALQRADGSWKLDDTLARALGFAGLERLRAALGRDLASQEEQRAAATALALVWLERECAASRDEWRLLAGKGREWLDRTPEGADAWLVLAAAALDRR